jgi:hypothetical protein
MRKTPLSLILLLILALPLIGEEEGAAAFDEWPDALGVYGSSLAGHPGGGLHWQHWFGQTGVAVSAGGLYTPSAVYGSILDYSLTAMFQRRVFGEDFAPWFSGQLYLWALAGHVGYIPMIYNSQTQVTSQGPFVGAALAGLGIGIEVILFRHFSAPFEVGYIGQFPNDTQVQLSFGGGFRYRY